MCCRNSKVTSVVGALEVEGSWRRESGRGWGYTETTGPRGHEENLAYLSEPSLGIHCRTNAIFSALEDIKINQTQTVLSKFKLCSVGAASIWVSSLSDPKCGS